MDDLEVKYLVITSYKSMCLYCEHRLAGRDRCDAFPGGIPLEILKGDFDHRYPYPGDQGIKFLAMDNKTKQIAAMMKEKGWQI